MRAHAGGCAGRVLRARLSFPSINFAGAEFAGRGNPQAAETELFALLRPSSLATARNGVFQASVSRWTETPSRCGQTFARHNAKRRVASPFDFPVGVLSL